MTEFNLVAAYEAAHKAKRCSPYVDKEYWADAAAGHLKEACDVIVKQNAELRQVRQGDGFKKQEEQVAKIKELEAQCEDLMQNCNSLRERAWKAEARIKELRAELASANVELMAAGETVRAKEAHIKELEDDIETAKASIRFDSEEIERVRADNAGLSTAEIERLQKENLELPVAVLGQDSIRTHQAGIIKKQATRIKELEDALVEAKATIKFCLDEGDEDENYGPMHDLPEWRELPEKDKKVFRDWCRKQLAVKCPVDAIYCSFRDEGNEGYEIDKAIEEQSARIKRTLTRRKAGSILVPCLHEEQATRIKELEDALVDARGKLFHQFGDVELDPPGEDDCRIVREMLRAEGKIGPDAALKKQWDEVLDEATIHKKMEELPTAPGAYRPAIREEAIRQLQAEGKIGPDASKPHIKEPEDALGDKPPVKLSWFYCTPDKKLQRGDLVQLPAELDGGTIGFVKGVDEQRLYNMGRIRSYEIVTDSGLVLPFCEESAEALEKPTPEQLEKFAKAVFRQWF